MSLARPRDRRARTTPRAASTALTLAVAAALLAAGVAGVRGPPGNGSPSGAAVGGPAGPGSAAGPSAAALAALRAAEAAFRPLAPPGTDPFAMVAGIPLHDPAAAPVAFGYHEAASRDAVPLAPLGRLRRNANRTRFERPEPSDGPAYLVMSSRGRGTPATSAVDVAITRGRDVLAPVSGVVAESRRYRLYDLFPDRKVLLIPVGRPDLRVAVIHLSGVAVRRGDRVVAGSSVLGRPRDLPFRSQVNDYIGPGIPHVHIEVKRIGRSSLQAPR